MTTTNGVIITDFGGYDKGQTVQVQPNGKIVVLGITSGSNDSSNDIAVAHYNSNGSLDTTFDADGKLTATGVMTINAMSMLSDGRFVTVGGNGSDFAVARYSSAGSLDNTFDKDGKLTTNASSYYGADEAYNTTIQADGKLLVVGYDGYQDEFAAVRYNSDGSLDKSFTGDGLFNGYDSSISGIATCACTTA